MKLRTCHHDGKPAKLWYNHRGWWEVGCTHCPAFVWANTANEAVTLWNGVT